MNRLDAGTAGYRPLLSWGAVIGGWLFAYAVAMLLYLFGAAVGLTSASAINELNAGITIGTGIWMITAWIIATFLGSILAGRLAGMGSKSSGVMHGMLVWALSGIMTLFIGAAQATAVTAMGATTAAQALQTGQGAAIPQQVSQAFSEQVKAEVSEVVARGPEAGNVNQQEIRQAIERLDAGTLTRVGMLLVRGNEQEARNVLSDNTGLSDQQITTLVGGLSQTAQGYASEFQQGLGQATEQAGDYASGALWAFFLASLLGLGAGVWGGSIGGAIAASAREVEAVDIRSYGPDQTRRAI